MTNQTKSPIFWAFVAFVLGIGLGIWGLIKEDCIGGPGCWVGSGFLKVTAVILIVAGVAGFFTIKGKGR
jgi:hypothetical protein